MTSTELASDQLKELLDIIRVRYSYDLGGYAEASLKRRLLRFARMAQVSVSDMKYHIINDSAFFSWMMNSLTVNVTEMFRDPGFYHTVRTLVLPELAKQSTIRIWHAGCSTGEEAFSMAILLHEAGLLSRSRVYATDINAGNIEKAAEGVLTLSKMQQYTKNYQEAGGIEDFSSYYTARYNSAIIDRELRRNINFSVHNLAADDVFGHFHLICCRNVLLYFKPALLNRSVGLFHRSLEENGILALGSEESLTLSHYSKKFDVFNKTWKMYKLPLST